MKYTLSGGEAGGLEVDAPEGKLFTVSVTKNVDDDGNEVSRVAELSKKGLQYDPTVSEGKEEAVYVGTAD